MSSPPPCAARRRRTPPPTSSTRSSTLPVRYCTAARRTSSRRRREPVQEFSIGVVVGDPQPLGAPTVTIEELRFYVDVFERSGFRGGELVPRCT